MRFFTRVLSFSLLFNLISLPSMVCTAEEILKIHTVQNNHSTDEQGEYFSSLLQLALEKTVSTDGPFEIVSRVSTAERERLRRQLESGQNLDVLWSSSNPEREKRYLPVRISLLKHLNEYRILLIRRDDLKLFHAINNFDDFQKITAGSGNNWSGTKIMALNNINTVLGPSHESLIRMLVANRFDYITRGLYEIDSTNAMVDWYGHSDKLMLEDSLLIYYKTPFYFFVRKDNHALADRLSRGLTKAIEDGSFDTLFFSLESNRKGYDVLTKEKRTVIELRSHYDTTH